ncbi:MAG TPA: hypothetical protein VJ499_04740 [Flavisolibacter sp.]|nr:hypothetical protein [Flavisolibacter sp.]
MHSFQVGDKVSFLNIFKQSQEGVIQDLVIAGGNYAYCIDGYDFIVLEKNITQRLVKADKKSQSWKYRNS